MRRSLQDERIRLPLHATGPGRHAGVVDVPGQFPVSLSELLIRHRRAFPAHPRCHLPTLPRLRERVGSGPQEARGCPRHVRA